ncbi:MAG: Na/Pi symporter [Lautropia sp.]
MRLADLTRPVAPLAAIVTLLVLAWAFWVSPAWLKPCAGLALFLFGMQCLEDGLRALAGSRLEQLIGRGTDTPRKGLLFGIGATMALQSSTLVSLLTIAFVSTGLLSLAGALPILFGANLGATSGIWLLALAGQNFSLAPATLPLLVAGVLAGVFGSRAKAAGRVVLGVAFIFLGIDWLKQGFEALNDGFDLSRLTVGGVSGQTLFTGIGLLMTVVLQSSHAALMLTLAALASNQIDLHQGLAIAIGANVGSSVSTAVVGMLGSDRGGRRLALAHVLFNGVTAAVASLLLAPLAWLVQAVFTPFGLGANSLLQLALFHTLFNGMGVALFWPWQARLASWLTRWLPDRPEPAVLIAPEAGDAGKTPPKHKQARYLSDSALASPATAAMAVARELLHLERLSLEVICLALYVPAAQLSQVLHDEQRLQATPPPDAPDAATLYQHHVKGVYGDLLVFMARMENLPDEAHQRFWNDCNLAALQLVEAVKDAQHLQKNLGRYLRGEPSEARDAYVALRRYLLQVLAGIRDLGREGAPAGDGAVPSDTAATNDTAAPSAPSDAGARSDATVPRDTTVSSDARVPGDATVPSDATADVQALAAESLRQWLSPLDQQAADFDVRFRARLLEALRHRHLDGLALSSLINDLGYANGIVRSLRNVLALAQGHRMLQTLRRQAGEWAESPVIDEASR